MTEMTDNDNILIDYGPMVFKADGGYEKTTEESIEWVTPDLMVIE